MKTMKKCGIAILLACVALFGALAILTTKTTAVLAADAQSFTMSKGAYLRINGEDTDEYGLRFEATLSATDYNEEDKFYVMIIPSSWIQQYGLTDGCDYFDVLVNQNGKVWQGSGKTVIIMESKAKAQSEETYSVSGSIKTIKYANSYREFFGIVFKTDADGNNRQYAKLNDNSRSISNVAAMALNDENAGYTESVKTFLNQTVKNAYNAYNGKTISDEQDDLPEITSGMVDMTVCSGSTFSAVPSGIPSGIGIIVKYSVQDDKASISKDGVVTANASEGSTKITAKVLGKNYVNTVAFRPAMADNMLEDFNVASSAKNVQYNQYGSCDGSGGGSWWPGTYHEEYAGATGVVEIAGHTEGASGYVPIRFSRTEAKLLKILNEMTSITIRVYVTTNQWVVPVGQSGKVLQTNVWQDITITKEQLLTGTTAEEFAKAHCNTGSGKGNTFKRANTKAGEDGTIYIDYISFNTVG